MLKNKFNASEVEPRLYKAWEESGAFKPRKPRLTDTSSDNYSIIIPPPNVPEVYIWVMQLIIQSKIF